MLFALNFAVTKKFEYSSVKNPSRWTGYDANYETKNIAKLAYEGGLAFLFEWTEEIIKKERRNKMKKEIIFLCSVLCLLVSV
jgi:hypothetical protein